MNLKKVSSAAIDDYLFCGLHFKLKHLYKLPYLPGSVKEAFYYAYRSALLKFFHEVGLANKPLGKCISAAQEVYVKKMRVALATFDKLTLAGEDLVAKGILQLNEAHTLFVPNRDVIAAIDLPIEVDYNGVAIGYNLDAMIIHNDHTLARQIRLLAIADDFSDLAMSNKHNGLHFGLMKQAVKDHFATGKKGAGNFTDAQAEIIKVSGAKSSISSASSGARPAAHLSPLLDTAIDGIQKQVFLPTAQESKCKSCWFNDICSAKLCGPVRDEDNVSHLITKMNAKSVRTLKDAAAKAN